MMELKSVGIILPNIWKNKKCYKPPTRHGKSHEIPFLKYPKMENPIQMDDLGVPRFMETPT